MLWLIPSQSGCDPFKHIGSIRLVFSSVEIEQHLLATRLRCHEGR